MTILSKISVTAANFDFEVKKFLQHFMAVDTVAAAGSVSTDATLLASNRNVVTAANGTKGVILSPASVDMAVEVVNTVADQDLLVYPANGEQINALTVTTGAFTIPGGSYTVFLCDANKHWYVAAKFSPDVLDMTGATGVPEIHLSANRADALSMEDTTGDIFSVATTTGALAFNFDKDVQVNVGVSASVTGSGFPLSATRTLAMGVYSDDNDAAISSGTLTRAGRFRNLQTYTGGNREQEAVGLIGQLVSVAGTNRHNMAGLMGSYEGSGALTIDGQAATTDAWIQAGVIGRVGVGSGVATLNANGVLTGVAAMSNTASLLANSGTYAAFYAGAWSGAVDWDYGLYVEPSKVGIGVGVGKFASSYATGSGLVFTAANTKVGAFYGESTSDLTNAVNARVGVFRHLIVTASGTINHETYGLIGQNNVKNSTLAHLHAGLMGTFEVSTAATVNSAYTYGAAGVMARLGVGTSVLTATKAICGFAAVYNGGALASGDSVAFAACSTTATNFTHFLAAANCDNFFYAATGTSYESGVKIAGITGLGAGASGVLRVKVDSTLYYMPLYAAGELSGE